MNFYVKEKLLKENLRIEKIEEIFDPNVVLTAAKNVKFGFPIGNDGTTITGI
jgi:hypothetical protein